MATIFSDNFDRADSTSLGANWTEAVGDVQVVSNKVGSVGATWAEVYDNFTIGSADYKVSATQICNTPAGNFIEIFARYTDWNNCYMVYNQFSEGDTTAYLFKRVSGTQTQLGSTYTFAKDDGHDTKFTVSCVGTAIKLYVDDVERVSVTDAAHSTEGKHGLRTYTNFVDDNYLLEDFNAGGGAAQVAKYNGIAIASIAKYQGIAKASIKKINGLTIQ